MPEKVMRNEEMWQQLGLDMDRHCELMRVLLSIYPDIYLKQANRPNGMGYFDIVVADIHGIRIRELFEHKQKGGKVFGTFCIFVPEELIWAVDGIAVGLCAGADFSIRDAEDILPSNLCPLIKSFFGFKVGKLCPYFESCDIVIGETTCDGKKKVYELLQEYVPTYVIHLPQSNTEQSRILWRQQIREFKTKVEQVSGKNITVEALREKTELLNNKRNALARLFRMRQHDPVPISGKDALLISQVGFYDNPARFTSQVQTLCNELEERVKKGQGAINKGAPRILLTGSPMAIPNWKIHHTIESLGAAVVCEEACIGTKYFSNPVNIPSNGNLDQLLDNIADRYLTLPCACFSPNDDRFKKVIQLAREFKADGVIDYNLIYCHTYSVEHTRLKKALQKENIPLLRIETDYGMGDAGQIRTRIEAFIEMISK
ncbi:MAG: double-cubane-cluster-containing anaerobic reductase [Planctomycetota bacterium]